jgi:hypothetical protein
VARGEAYCVEAKKNITLRDAHDRYFAQPDGKRKRLSFMCGDPKCRAIARPKVVGAIYDRPDAFDPDACESDRHRAPYYRRHIRFPHIEGCTWDEPVDEETEADEPARRDHTVNIGEKGLIWLPEAPDARQKLAKKPDEGKPPPDDGDDEKPSDRHSTRPDSTRFLATVGMSYLTMTDAQLQRIPLQISRTGTKGTFWTVCLPVSAYHPAFRAERIYFGEATIAKLTNVFILTFKRRFSPSGDRSTRNTVAKVKFLKRALEEDRMLGEVLEKAVAAGQDVRCFMHVTEPPEQKVQGAEQRAWFAPSARDHIFIVPVSMVIVARRVAQWPENAPGERT